jgi:hypothetical protein
MIGRLFCCGQLHYCTNPINVTHSFGNLAAICQIVQKIHGISNSVLRYKPFQSATYESYPNVKIRAFGTTAGKRGFVTSGKTMDEENTCGRSRPAKAPVYKGFESCSKRGYIERSQGLDMQNEQVIPQGSWEWKKRNRMTDPLYHATTRIMSFLDPEGECPSRCYTGIRQVASAQSTVASACLDKPTKH